MTELVRYEAARRAIAEAVAVDEVTEIRSKAEALRHYARQAGDRGLEIDAAQIRFRAERKMGELLIAAKEAGQISRGQPPKNSAETEEFSEGQISRVTLREAGIDHKLSARAQRVAAMDAADFEQALERHAEEMRAGQGRVAMDLLKIGAEEKGRAHRRDLAQALSAQSAALPVGRVYPATYIDPPWKREGGIGNRAYENHYPTMSWPQILDYLRQARGVLLPDAWAFIWIPRAHLLALVEIEIEVTVAESGEVVLASVDMPLAWAVGQALGMDSYSTCFVWTKTDAEHPDDSGSGLIAWDQDELLLLFRRGRGLPKPAGSEKFGSNYRERAREHSRKPDFYRHMIATMVGSDTEGRPLPVLEMFARVDAEHPLPPGWDACGNQAGENSRANAGDISAQTKSEPEGIEAPASRAADGRSSDGDAPSHGGASSDFASLLVPSGGETATAAAEATSARASAAAAVAYDSEPAFPPAELYELLRFADRDASGDLERDRRAEIEPLAAGYVARGLVHEWCGEWRLTKSGEIRIDVLERERAAREQIAQRALSLDDFAEWHDLEAVVARQPLDGAEVRHLVGLDLAGVTTKRVYLTTPGERRLAELEAIIDRAAGVTLPAPTPIAPRQLDLVEMLQGAG